MQKKKSAIFKICEEYFPRFYTNVTFLGFIRNLQYWLVKSFYIFHYVFHRLPVLQSCDVPDRLHLHIRPGISRPIPAFPAPSGGKHRRGPGKWAPYWNSDYASAVCGTFLHRLPAGGCHRNSELNSGGLIRLHPNPLDSDWSDLWCRINMCNSDSEIPEGGHDPWDQCVWGRPDGVLSGLLHRTAGHGDVCVGGGDGNSLFPGVLVLLGTTGLLALLLPGRGRNSVENYWTGIRP